jgi:hypothetical protein
MTAHGRRGVTLVELVVAPAVTGLVLAAAHALLGVVVDALHRSRADRTMAEGEAARVALAGWLRAAALPDSDAAFDGIPGWRIGGESDTLRFVIADGGPLYPGPHHVALWVDTDPRSEPAGLLASIGPWPAVGARAETLVVSQRATMLQARYLVSRQRTDVWVDSVHARAELPYAIELRIDIPAPPGRIRPAGDAILTLPLVVPVAASRW